EQVYQKVDEALDSNIRMDWLETWRILNNIKEIIIEILKDIKNG
ncbi:17822_t:CDS:1, partial [Gigaspora margarita]